MFDGDLVLFGVPPMSFSFCCDAFRALMLCRQGSPQQTLAQGIGSTKLIQIFGATVLLSMLFTFAPFPDRRNIDPHPAYLANEIFPFTSLLLFFVNFAIPLLFMNPHFCYSNLSKGGIQTCNAAGASGRDDSEVCGR